MLRKPYILIIIFLVFSLHGNLSAQRIKGAVIAGMNLSQVDGDEVYGFSKVGMNTGVSAILPIGKWFSFSIETIYSQKGSKQGEQYYDSVELVPDSIVIWTGAYKLNLDYLEVPVLFHFNDRNIFSAGVGFSYGRLVNVKEYEHGRRVTTTSLNSGVYKRSDWNILFDLQFRLHKKISKFKFNIRYAYSMSKLRTRDYFNSKGEYTGTRHQYNNLFSFRVIYVFNEKPARIVDPD